MRVAMSPAEEPRVWWPAQWRLRGELQIRRDTEQKRTASWDQRLGFRAALAVGIVINICSPYFIEKYQHQSSFSVQPFFFWLFL